MKRRGNTLIEVLASGALMVLVLGIVSSATWMVRGSFYGRTARLEARQEARKLLAELAREVRSGGRIFSGFTGTMDGQSYQVPAPGQSGDSVIFASPEDDPPTRWTVYGLSTRPDPNPDPQNPLARQVVLYRRAGLVTVSPNPALVTGGTLRVYDCSVPPDNFTVTVGLLSDSLTLEMWSEKRPIDGLSHLQQHSLHLTLRNSQ
jgi:hypothetical protein